MARHMTLDVMGLGPTRVEFERRRYGTGASSRNFTWGTVVTADGERLSLGDPWPKINPSRADVSEAAQPALIGRSMERLAGAKGRH